MSFQMVLLPWSTAQLREVTFWNYVIPDGSTTISSEPPYILQFGNYVIPDGSTTVKSSACARLRFWNYVIPDGSTT